MRSGFDLGRGRYTLWHALKWCFWCIWASPTMQYCRWPHGHRSRGMYKCACFPSKSVQRWWPIGLCSEMCCYQLLSRSTPPGLHCPVATCSCHTALHGKLRVMFMYVLTGTGYRWESGELWVSMVSIPAFMHSYIKRLKSWNYFNLVSIGLGDTYFRMSWICFQSLGRKLLHM